MRPVSTMASSRIFIKGLPPTITESEFAQYFSQKYQITDAKLFANRRIGYVGYKTPEDAQKAVKYFNKSFIRMSRIGVELARPVPGTKNGSKDGSAPAARRYSGVDGSASEENKLKRKRESNDGEEQNPKLKEFLNVMKPKSKKKAWDFEGQDLTHDQPQVEQWAVPLVDEPSDEEYDEVQKKNKRHEKPPEIADQDGEESSPIVSNSPADAQEPEVGQEHNAVDVSEQDHHVVSDADWTRSRTSRLLGLLDEDEKESMPQPRKDGSLTSQPDSEPDKGMVKNQQVAEAPNSLPTPPSGDEEGDPGSQR